MSSNSGLLFSLPLTVERTVHAELVEQDQRWFGLSEQFRAFR
uniref:Uncharacterized protein n=1 Tax=Ochrobactrum sp. SJY1 TaxID=1526653 RepID=A0A075X8L4_9HYPH|nr:hypothetical protein [Ochrobactrum sp. SJY1]